MNLKKIRRTIRSALRKIARMIDPPHPDQTLGNVTYSQHGEDIVIASIMHTIGIETPLYLDIGAHHPFHISNTALLYQAGASGINVEANPFLIEAFLHLRPRDITINAAIAGKAGEQTFYFIDDHSGRNTCDLDTALDFIRSNNNFSIQKSSTIKSTTVDCIYLEYIAPRAIDLLSIDIEGLDQEVLESVFSSKIFPTVIVVEIVSGDNKSSNALAIRKILEDNGYFICIRLAANYIAIRNEYRHLFQ